MNIVPNMNFTPYLAILAAAMILAAVFTALLIFFCRKYSLYDYPGKHKRHQYPTPTLGGVAVFLAFWIVLFLLRQMAPLYLKDISDYFVHIFLGSLVILLIGILDDLRPLPAWPKLLAQILAGLILFWGGMAIRPLTIPGVGIINLGHWSAVITVLWVVSFSNAINLIDGLDGLATGVSGIAAATMAIIGMLFGIESVIAISLALLGSLAAFWFYNRRPARIFLGDSGSLMIGYLFAVISLVVPIKSFAAAALFLPLVVLGVPLTETVTSFLRRLAAGKNVMKADRRHLFHYLAHTGMSSERIVAFFYLSGVIFSLISIAMFFFERILLLGFLLLFMVVILIIYFIFMAKFMKR